MSSVVALIPARGGSKGVPGKNLVRVGGRSLVRRAIDACHASPAVDYVVVTTDDGAIARAATDAGAEVVTRPAALADDQATSESALLHALEALGPSRRPDIAVFVQCTSPFIRPEDITAAVDVVARDAADVVFSARASHEFLWEDGADGFAVGLGHDSRERRRRQDRRPQWSETGAFYVMRADGFVHHGHRFFGRILPHAVEASTAIEIDTPQDLHLAHALAGLDPDIDVDVDPDVDPDIDPGLHSGPGGGDVAALRLLVTDFDGVHTNDRAVLCEDGSESVTVSRRDGFGIRLLREAGFEMLVLSTETNPVVSRRAEKLGVRCIQGVDDKWPRLRALLADEGYAPTVVGYVGNDLNDLECIQQVGWGVAVADADPRVRSAADYVTTACGGDGALREIADLLIDARVARLA